MSKNIVLTEWETLADSSCCRRYDYHCNDGRILSLPIVYLIHFKQDQNWHPFFYEPLYLCRRLLVDSRYDNLDIAKQNVDQFLIRVSNLTAFL